MLTAGRHRHRHRVHAGDARRRPDHRLDEPADPTGRGSLMVDVIDHAPARSAPGRSRRPRPSARRPGARRCELARSGGRPSSSATSSSSVWIVCAVLGQRITPYDPFNDFAAGHLPPSAGALLGTDRLGRDVLSRVMVGSRDVLIVAPLAALLGVDRRDAPRPDHGLLPGHRRRRPEPDRRGVPGAAGHPRRAADARRARARRRSSWSCVVGILFTPIVARTVRSAVLAERAARLRHGGQAARRVGAVHPVARDLPERPRADRRRDDRPLRLRDLHRRHAVVPRRRPPAAVARLGPDGQRGVHQHDLAASGGRRCSRRWPSPARSSPST